MTLRFLIVLISIKVRILRKFQYFKLFIRALATQLKFFIIFIIFFKTIFEQKSFIIIAKLTKLE